MRMSPLASLFAFALFAVGTVACSANTEPAEGEGESEEGAQEADDEVQVEVASPTLDTQSTCGTYCTRNTYSAIYCNLNGVSGKAAYTCRPRYGASYQTGCITSRGASYCLPYF